MSKNPEAYFDRMRDAAQAAGFDVEGSASRQHYIDTGRYLLVGEGPDEWPEGVHPIVKEFVTLWDGYNSGSDENGVWPGSAADFAADVYACFCRLGMLVR